MELWLQSGPELTGTSGTPTSARAVAAAWCERSGGSSHCRMRQALHALDEVRDPPRPAGGALRLPLPEERPLLVANPTSNKIYAEVGYVQQAEWEEHAFTPAGPGEA